VVVAAERSANLWRAARNLERVHVVTPNGLNLLDILRLPRLVLTEAAVSQLTATLTADLKPATESPTVAAAEAETPEPPKRARRAKTTEPVEVEAEADAEVEAEAEAEPAAEEASE
jgi:hypothetical protein